MPRIDCMYAYVAEGSGPDDEGVTAFLAGDRWMPMVGADMKRMESLRGHAQDLASTSGKTIKLLRFSVRSELEVIEP